MAKKRVIDLGEVSVRVRCSACKLEIVERIEDMDSEPFSKMLDSGPACTTMLGHGRKSWLDLVSSLRQALNQRDAGMTIQIEVDDA